MYNTGLPQTQATDASIKNFKTSCQLRLVFTFIVMKLRLKLCNIYRLFSVVEFPFSSFYGVVAFIFSIQKCNLLIFYKFNI